MGMNFRLILLDLKPAKIVWDLSGTEAFATICFIATQTRALFCQYQE
jgi:hypothetical protein